MGSYFPRRMQAWYKEWRERNEELFTLISNPDARTFDGKEQPEIMDNVDLCGSSANMFFFNVDRKAAAIGARFVVADMPKPKEGDKTRADDKKSGRKPYFIDLPALSVPDWSLGADGGLDWAVPPPAESSPSTPCSEPAADGVGSEKASDPSLEFLELRELYDREGIPEAPMAGHVEFLTACKRKQWPGIARIAQAIGIFTAMDGQWQKGDGRYRPGLGRFLREQWWLKTPVPPKARLPGEKTAKEREAEEALASAMYLQEIKHGIRANNPGPAQHAQPSLPAQHPA